MPAINYEVLFLYPPRPNCVAEKVIADAKAENKK